LRREHDNRGQLTIALVAYRQCPRVSPLGPRAVSRIKVADAAMATANPIIYEFSSHVDTQSKQIVASLPTSVEGMTTQTKRYARTQCLMTGRMICRPSTPSTG
jgi:hypothetical protein